MTENRLGLRIKNNVSRYFEHIESSEDIKIDIKKGNNIASHAKHFHCYVRHKNNNASMEDEHIFIKYASIDEFNNLLMIQEIMKNGQDAPKVPFAYDYFEDSEMIVMEGIKGKNLLIWFLVNLLPVIRIVNRRELMRKVQLCASWLAQFHNMTFIRNDKNINSELEIARKRLEEIPLINNKQKKELNIYFSEAQERSGSFPIVLTNRDYSLRNILLVSRCRVAVVDWAQLIEKNIYYSIAYFNTNLESRSRHRLYTSNIIDSLKQTFWNEYQRTIKFDVNESARKLVQVLYYVEYIYEYHTKTGVFEEWPVSKKTMDCFINQLIDKLTIHNL